MSVQNYIRLWESCCHSDTKEGYAWYPEAARLIQSRIVDIPMVFHEDIVKIACVAATSVQKAWPDMNMLACNRTIATGTGHMSSVLYKVMRIIDISKNVDNRDELIANISAILDTSNAPVPNKTCSFFYALIGESVPVVDAHMHAIHKGLYDLDDDSRASSYKLPVMRRSEYRSAYADMIKAADIAGCKYVHWFQATLWCRFRRMSIA